MKHDVARACLIDERLKYGFPVALPLMLRLDYDVEDDSPAHSVGERSASTNELGVRISKAAGLTIPKCRFNCRTIPGSEGGANKDSSQVLPVYGFERVGEGYGHGCICDA